MRVLKYLEVLYLPNNNLYGPLARNIGKFESLIELNTDAKLDANLDIDANLDLFVFVITSVIDLSIDSLISFIEALIISASDNLVIEEDDFKYVSKTKSMLFKVYSTGIGFSMED
jgi:hypothetical protein